MAQILGPNFSSCQYNIEAKIVVFKQKLNFCSSIDYIALSAGNVNNIIITNFLT